MRVKRNAAQRASGPAESLGVATVRAGSLLWVPERAGFEEEGGEGGARRLCGVVATHACGDGGRETRKRVRF